VRDLAEEKGGARKISDLERLGFEWWRRHLSEARPRTLSLLDPTEPIIIFTDGAVEEEVSVGGILIARGAGRIEYFGEVVPTEVAASWGRKRGDEQVIGQAEIAPLTLAALLWQEALCNEHVIFFVDNDSARDAAVRGYSPSLASAELVSSLWGALAAAAAVPWFDRVPGPSNPADDPSRMRFKELVQAGARRARIPDGMWRRVRTERNL